MDARGVVLLLLLAGCLAGCAAPPSQEASPPGSDPGAWSVLPALPPGLHDIVYPVDGVPNVARVGIPAVHDGGIVLLGKGLFTSLDTMNGVIELLAANGHIAVAPEFRGPEGTWKVRSGAQDMAVAASELHDAYPDARMTAFGFSMGAEVVALAATQTDEGVIDDLVLGGPVTDLAQTWRTQTSWQALIEDEAGGTPDDVPAAYAALSPMQRVPDLAGPPRIHLVHALADTLVPVTQSERYHAALDRAAVPGTLHIVASNPGAWICTPLIALCSPPLPAGPANHEASIIGPVWSVLWDVLGGRWTDLEDRESYLIDGVTGIETPLQA